MSALPKTTWTVESYLAFERQSDIRHEFRDGEIYAMSGASRNHNRIASNVNGIFFSQLATSPCEAFQSDLRVRVSPSNYTYPDVVVVCGEAQFEDKEVDTLLNPTVIIEVLSPSTESYDRGDKFRRYRGLDSLQEYVLIAQDNYYIEHYVRQSEGQWLFSEAAQPDDVVVLPSINCTLLLSQVYQKVTFEETKE
jgi:Uma2 family endonuclease